MNRYKLLRMVILSIVNLLLRAHNALPDSPLVLLLCDNESDLNRRRIRRWQLRYPPLPPKEDSLKAAATKLKFNSKSMDENLKELPQ